MVSPPVVPTKSGIEGTEFRLSFCAKISVCHGVGGMFAASDTVIFSNGPP
jgi:hypothetical protein